MTKFCLQNKTNNNKTIDYPCLPMTQSLTELPQARKVYMGTGWHGTAGHYDGEPPQIPQASSLECCSLCCDFRIGTEWDQDALERQPPALGVRSQGRADLSGRATASALKVFLPFIFSPGRKGAHSPPNPHLLLWIPPRMVLRVLGTASSLGSC